MGSAYLDFGTSSSCGFPVIERVDLFILASMGTTKKSTGAKSKLPGALAKRASAASAAKQERLLRRAHELLALVQRRKADVSDAFYDMGEALRELKTRDMLSALGRKSFAEMCEKDAGLSAAMGQRLVEVVDSMTREQAIEMGSKKAMAMVALADATPERDTAAGLYRRKSVKLPGGKSVAPRGASANELERAAKAVRQSRPKTGPARGRTTTAEERQLAELLQRKLRKLGLPHATVTAVATKPGQGGDFRFEHIPIAKVDVLKKAIGA